MNTLLDSERYTKEKKKHQLKKLETSHYLDVNKKFNDFLIKEPLKRLSQKSSIALNLEYISSWYLWKYIDGFFEKEYVEYNLLAESTKYAYCSNYLNYAIGEVAPNYDSPVLLRTAVMNLGQMLFLGWDELAAHYGKILITMLEGKYYKGGLSRPLYIWFILELFCKWQNISLNKSNLNYPDSLGIYEKALNNLYSRDETMINKIIDELADFHIKNSDEYVTTDEFGNETSAEFVSSDYFIFPVEILMYLSIRKRLGMPEYRANNELMSLVINHFPDHAVKYPTGDMIDAVFEKIYRENPELKL
jgi:hypothetical protein